MKRIMVFGTGNGWIKIKKIFNYKKLTIEAFIDNDQMKVGKKFDKKRVILPKEIENYQYDYIIIASQYYGEITKQLISLNIPKERIIPFYEYASLLYYDLLDFIIPKCYQDQVVLDKISECEVEIAKILRGKKTNQVGKVFESFQKLFFDSNKDVFLKILILLEDNQIEAAKELIIKKLEGQGLPLKYNPTPYTQITFKEKEVPTMISVIIPVYKDVEGLKDTLASLCTQTIGRDQYEIIVINDGGEPAITQLCNDYRVRVIEHKPNRGSYYSRNRGIEKSKGKFLAFVDADIIVPTDWLEKGIKALMEYDYIAGDIKIDETKVTFLTNYYELKTAFPVKDFFQTGHFGPTANVFVKRSVLEQIGGFDERLMSAGDREFGERIFRYTNLKQAYIKSIFVIHPPRDYRGLIKKFDRIYKGYNDLTVLYPERFKLYKISFLKFVKEFFTPPSRIIYDSNYPFGYVTLFFYFWWIKNVKVYKKMRCLKGRTK